MSRARFLLLAVLLAGAAVTARVAAQSAWSPERLSPAARRVVHERMQTHAREMSELVWDVILLDYDRAATHALALAKAATPLDRNAPALEHHVYFFTLQDQLRTRALVLGDAARAQDAIALSTAFKQVSETCVHCHAVYLPPAPAGRQRPAPAR